MAFIDLSWEQGKQNMAGLIGDIYFVPIEDVDDTLLPAVTGVGELSISANITLKATKKFFKIYHTSETGKVESNSVGERDGKSVESMLEFFHPGNSEEVAKFKRQVLNTNGLWLYEDTDGNFRILGLSVLDPGATATSLALKASVEAGNTTTGDQRGSQRGTTFTVKFTAPHDPLFYSGLIDVTV